MAGDDDEAGTATEPAQRFSLQKLFGRRPRPAALLAGLATVSLGLRCFRLGEPRGPMGDEIYYVNAARDIIGQHSATSPLRVLAAGLDSNPAHPPLAKLLMGASMRLFGDNPVAWRIPSVIFGTVAILLMYALVRAVHGRPAVGLAAASLMAVDNLLLVHGRMATLDIFVVTFMVAAVVLYLRRRWALAGVAVALAACSKLVGLDVLIILGLLEVGRLLIRRRAAAEAGSFDYRPWLALGGCAVVTMVGYLVLLGAMDHFVGREKNPWQHTLHMISALSLPNTHGTSAGLVPSPDSGPLQWLVDREPIPYWRHPAAGAAALDFQGVITPLIIFAAIPALFLCGLAAWREGDGTALLALAWFGGTIGPFVYAAVQHRTTFLYYMVIVMPGIYLAVARALLSRPRPPDVVRLTYALGVLYQFVAFFPVRSWSGD